MSDERTLKKIRSVPTVNVYALRPSAVMGAATEPVFPARIKLHVSFIFDDLHKAREYFEMIKEKYDFREKRVVDHEDAIESAVDDCISQACMLEETPIYDFVA